MEVILRQLEVRLPRYGPKDLYADFKIGFIAFVVLFLEHWRLLCVDWRNGSQYTAENGYCPACILGLQHSPLYF